MVGMVQILIYMFAAYFVFKAVEILQIALMSPRQDRTAGLVIGKIALALALAVGAYFSAWAIRRRRSVSTSVERTPR